MLLISTERRRVLSLPLVSAAAALVLGLWLGATIVSASRSDNWQGGGLAVIAVFFAVALIAAAARSRGAQRVGDELRWFSVTGRSTHPAARCELRSISRTGRPNTFTLELRDHASGELLFEVFSIIHGPTAELRASEVAAALDLPQAKPRNAQRAG